MPWKWWLARIVGVALVVAGAALYAHGQESTGSAGVIPLVPNGSTPTALPGSTPAAPAPVVPPTAPPAAPAAPAAATGPAGTTATPAITVTIPHDEHLHWTVVRHLHFPSRAAKAAPAPKAVPPAEPVRATPQAPWKSLFGR